MSVSNPPPSPPRGRGVHRPKKVDLADDSINPNSLTRVYILQPDIRKGPPGLRDGASLLEEARGLAAAIRLQIAGTRVFPLLKPTPATLFGKGQVEEAGAFVAANKVDLVFVNGALSPVQQRNLERAWKAKVIDRTGLILEIFGARARTAEGQLQVELAALTYQRSRLVRSWTHLERQRGGFGFLGGPGESQLEIDRRLIGRRILKIKSELQQVRRTRALHRAARQRAGQPVIALVGYTNAGKSTLFNRLTGSQAFAEDLLFATLDPAMRLAVLPSGTKAILSDTVGFISGLPMHLVEAFRATLEEVRAADIILHVRDAAHSETRAQKEDVEDVLDSLGVKKDDPRLIEVLNKVDLLDEDARTLELAHAGRMGRESLAAQNWPGAGPGVRGGSAAVSALTGEGIDGLLALLDEKLAYKIQSYDIRLRPEDGARLAWLYEHGRVLSRQDGPRGMRLKVALSETGWNRFRRMKT